MPLALRELRPSGLSVCRLLGLPLTKITTAELLDVMFARDPASRGGWLITANLDFLRRWDRNATVRALYAQADLVVADGMPLVWAARLQGDELPERVAGASLVWAIAARAAQEGRSLFLLGGDGDAAARAACRLQELWPNLQIAGTANPSVSSPPTPQDIERITAAVGDARPDFMLVALGSPKQEQVIASLRHNLPSTWMMGVGISLSFVAGDVRRAPPWMQLVGLEWVHRMAQEPRRLAKRYLIDDVPFAAILFLRVWQERSRRKAGVSIP